MMNFIVSVIVFAFQVILSVLLGSVLTVLMHGEDGTAADFFLASSLFFVMTQIGALESRFKRSEAKLDALLKFYETDSILRAQVWSKS